MKALQQIAVVPIAVSLVLGAVAAKAAENGLPAIELSGIESRTLTPGHFEFRMDTDKRDDIAASRERSFLPASGPEFSNALGYKNARMFLRFQLRNPTDRMLTYYARYDYPSMQIIHFGVEDSQGGLSIEKTGKLYPFHERPINNKSYVFPVSILPQSTVTCYMMLETTGSIQIPMTLLTPQDYNELVQKEYMGNGLYYGFVFMILIYSLFTFYTTRDRNYLFYAVYISSVALTQAALHGYAYQYLWPGLVRWNTISSLFLVGTTFVSLSLLTAHFLQTRINTPRLHVLLVVYGGMSAFLSVATPLFYGNLLIRFAGVLVALMPVVMIPVTIVSWRKGVKSASFFFSAIVLYAVGAACYGLKDMGVLPANFFTQNGIVIGSVFEILLFALGLGQKMKWLSEERQKFARESAEFKAVAAATQYLAHDVRKPFAQLRVVLSRLQSAGPLEVPGLVERYVPYVHKALQSVNGMIEDVMQVGSSTKLQRKDVPVEAIIAEVLEDSFGSEGSASIDLRYEFKHRHMVCVDRLRMSRVISNLVGNAAEAIGQSGEIWIKTSERQGWLQLVIGNSNSYIPESRRRRLFDAFYTEGKASGVGLGLAIVKKNIQDHGGKIWCQSAPGYGTEFHMTIPCSQALSNFSETLPKSAHAICEANEERLRLAREVDPLLKPKGSESSGDITLH